MLTKDEFDDMIAMALGGRIAEELTFRSITTGASNDLETATSIARNMVTRYGMSQKLGPRTYGKREELVFLGREITEQRNYSEQVAEQIDQEVYAIIQSAYDKATEVLTTHKAKLIQIARHLMAHETVEGEQLQQLFKSEAPPIEAEPTETIETGPATTEN